MRLTIIKERWWHLPQQIRFLIAGGYNTAFGYLAFVILYLAGRHLLHYLLIGVLANGMATISAFLVHRTFVFRSDGAWGREFLRFYASQLVSVAFATGLLYVLVRACALSPLKAQAVVTVASVAVSYGMHHYFTFAVRRYRS